MSFRGEEDNQEGKTLLLGLQRGAESLMKTRDGLISRGEKVSPRFADQINEATHILAVVYNATKLAESDPGKS